jgi:riboflavin kinase/FMN adenylyltransferase
VEGDRRGRDLGFPTANVPTDGMTAVPADGVYAGWLRRLDTGETFPAAISVGTNPTFGAEPVHVEAFLLEFDGDLVGERVSIEFVARLRDERRFDTPDALVDAIADDVRRTRESVPDP